MFENLVPQPLHPAVVHLPIALTVLVPIFAVGSLITIKRGARALRAWSVTAALLAALSLSAWVALETGEDQEDKVEAVVPHRAFENHEESAERFFTLSLVVLGIGALGLASGKVGTIARYAASASTLALVVVGYNVGRSGGDLVYEHGAASAYVSPATRLAIKPSDRETRESR